MLLSIALAASVALPAPVTERIPARANFALYSPHVRPDLLRALGVVEGLFGEGAAESFLDRAPLPYLALEAAAGAKDSEIDGRGGLGLFRVSGVSASVGLVAVRDPDAALRSLAERLEAELTAGDAGLTWLRAENGNTLLAFTRAGYLYLLMPDPELEDARPVLRKLADSLRADFAPLGQDPRFASASLGVASGQVALYASGFEAADPVRATFFSVTLTGATASLDGLILADRPLLTGGSKIHIAGLPGSVASAWVNCAPADLARLFFGPNETVRGRWARRLLATFALSPDDAGALEPPMLAAVALVPDGHGETFPALRLSGTPGDPDRMASVARRVLAGNPGIPVRLELGARSEMEIGRWPVKGKTMRAPALPGPGEALFVLDLANARRLKLPAATRETLDLATQIDHAWLRLSGASEGARVHGRLWLTPQ